MGESRHEFLLAGCHDRCPPVHQEAARTLMLDGAPALIVGVMPPGFAFPTTGTELWTPRRSRGGVRRVVVGQRALHRSSLLLCSSV